MARKILLVTSEPAASQRYQYALTAEGYEVHTCREATPVLDSEMFDLIVVREEPPEVVGLEVLRQVKAGPWLAPVVIFSKQPDVEAAVAAVKEGAVDYRREPCSAEELRRTLHSLAADLWPAARRCVPEASGDSPSGFEGMLGQCPAMLDVFDLIRRIAPADSTVLVSGESGTGKEMVVRAIHRHSRRRDYPLLACDCTALAPTLLESELFGHVKGSFSGAIATKQGLFEVAHQGTLFLDEVANLSLETQGKLLRVLETRRVRKVGDTAEREVDIRLVATTNRSLAEMVKVGQFRADLYYRLNVVPIALPPLRERGGDIRLLAESFLHRFCREMGIQSQGFSAEALQQMEIYPWPGNVRELRNIVERLAVLYGGARVELRHLPPEIREAKPPAATAELPQTWEEFKRLKRQVVDDLERRFLLAALQQAGYNITQAAENVGMQRPNFYALLRAHGLRPENPKR